MNVQTILKISRPRFWMYLAGPYLVGFVFGMSQYTQLASLQFIVHMIYFLLFANIFLYGVNDWYDRDTDKYNRKKGSKEHKLRSNDNSVLRRWLWISAGLGVMLMFFWYSPLILASWLVWFALSWFYSAPPIRFKSSAFFDSLSNVLYILPGVIGFIHSSGSLPPISIFIGAWAWAAGMHLYSAIPDIKADARARVRTTAVAIGAGWSSILVLVYWLITAILTVRFHAWWTLPLLLYPCIMIVHVALPKQFRIANVYWLFPYINAVVGFLLFVGGMIG